ncbi:MAG: hypothetical protein M9904_13500 [Chitinophagaceae bacterium]|nr:hypothetical protein [Chitinophagaceae bacterium]
MWNKLNTYKEKLIFLTGLPYLVVTLALVGCDTNSKTLFHDDFQKIKPQMVSGGVVGAFAEYQNISATQPVGDWLSSCFRSGGSQRAWRLVEENGKHIMYQTYTEDPKVTKYMHLMVVSGDSLWQDYTTQISFLPESKDGLSGVQFRYQTDRNYLFFGVRGDTAMIMKVDGSDKFREVNHYILAKTSYSWKLGDTLSAKVNVKGDHITAYLNNKLLLEADDNTYAKGKIGLMADIPTRYFNVDVSTDRQSYDEFKSAKAKFEKEISELRAGNPTPVLWKKIMTPEFGTGRNLRFGDLDGDGQTDILIGQMLNHGPKDRNSEVSCLTAISVDGKILWQVGEPDLWNDRLTSDVAFQIYDIDGDGKNEVIYCKDMQLIIADGATGKTKLSVPTPKNEASHPYNKFPRILGDAMYICNVEGYKRPQNILIKDRYEHFYIYNHKLQLLWKGECKTGHYPFAWDIDGDGRDEIAIGYSLYDDDGKQLFSLDKEIKDHADGIAIVKLKKDGPYVIMSAASDEGLVYYDLKGNILHHYQVGHAQNPVLSNLRNDLPGLEGVTVNFWATQGIINYINSSMEIYKTFEPFQQGSPMLPTNWTGKDEEFLTLSTDPNYGGMIDGYGRNVVAFPADGHPDMCYEVLDIMGDCRDEIVTWDASEIWIYTQSDNPKKEDLYCPVRNPLYNLSNYPTAVSYPPDWFDDGNSTFETWKKSGRK